MSDLIWPLQLLLAAGMTGVIWQVQLLTYPQFLNVPPTAFTHYHGAHTTRMGWIVGPPMLAELALAAFTAWQIPGAGSWLALSLVIGLWLTTALIHVPLHRQLAHGYDPVIIHRLIATNWLRTVLWSARAVLVLWLAARAQEFTTQSHRSFPFPDPCACWCGHGHPTKEPAHPRFGWIR